MRRYCLLIVGLLFGLSSRNIVLAADAASPAPVAASTATTTQPSISPAPPRSGLNELRGKLLSKNDDPKTLRLTVDGGFSVEFAYDGMTTFINGGNPVAVADLNYGDELIIRYAGKDLVALEVDRVSKAARPY